jgi:hypothetical protein
MGQKFSNQISRKKGEIYFSGKMELKKKNTRGGRNNVLFHANLGSTPFDRFRLS